MPGWRRVWERHADRRAPAGPDGVGAAAAGGGEARAWRVMGMAEKADSAPPCPYPFMEDA